MNFRSVTYRALNKMHQLESAPKLKKLSILRCGEEPCIVACCDHLVAVLTYAFLGLGDPSVEKKVAKLVKDLACLREEVHVAVETGTPMKKSKRRVTTLLSNYTRLYNYLLKQEKYSVAAAAGMVVVEWPSMIFGCVASRML